MAAHRLHLCFLCFVAKMFARTVVFFADSAHRRFGAHTIHCGDEGGSLKFSGAHLLRLSQSPADGSKALCLNVLT